MHRRFKSPGFTCFLWALKSLTAAQIKTSVAFYMQTREIPLSTLTTQNEAYEELIPDILYSREFESPESKCPYMWEQYENSGQGGADVEYTAESASEFHQVLIYCLENAAATVAEFVNTYKTVESLANDDKLLAAVEEWMGHVYLMVNHSAIFKVHVEALDSDITRVMRKPRDPSTYAIDNHNDQSNDVNTITQPPGQEDEGNDGGLSDTVKKIKNKNEDSNNQSGERVALNA